MAAYTPLTVTPEGIDATLIKARPTPEGSMQVVALTKTLPSWIRVYVLGPEGLPLMLTNVYIVYGAGQRLPGIDQENWQPALPSPLRGQVIATDHLGCVEIVHQKHWDRVTVFVNIPGYSSDIVGGIDVAAGVGTQIVYQMFPRAGNLEDKVADLDRRVRQIEQRFKEEPDDSDLQRAA